jgi:hypothetical protein
VPALQPSYFGGPFSGGEEKRARTSLAGEHWSRRDSACAGFSLRACASNGGPPPSAAAGSARLPRISIAVAS